MRLEEIVLREKLKKDSIESFIVKELLKRGVGIADVVISLNTHPVHQPKRAVTVHPLPTRSEGSSMLLYVYLIWSDENEPSLEDVVTVSDYLAGLPPLDSFVPHILSLHDTK